MKLPKYRALLAAASAMALAAPVSAQMNHSNMPGMSMPGMKMPAKKPAPAKKKPAAKKAPAKKASATKKSSAKKAAVKPSAKKPAADPQAGHDMSTMPGMTMPPAAPQPEGEMPAGHDMSTMPGMTMPPAAPPQGQMPAGHDMSTMPGMTMPPAAPPQGQMPPGHDMGSMPASAAGAEGTDLPAGNGPAPPVPVANAGDAFYDPRAMEMGRHHLQKFHGGQKLFQVLNNIMEYRGGSGADGYGWDSEGWYGGDINRVWFKSEGEGTFGEGVESAEIQALYSHAIDPYWNVQGGIRYDFRPNPSRAYATVQLEGLAPNFFDVEGALFLSNKGEVMARASGWFDQRITQRLILQPRVEFNLAAQNSRDIGVGAGLSEAEFGFRLRYDIRREFAPYVGIQYQRAFGRTARYLRDEGDDVGGLQFLAGVRTWF